MNNGADAMFEGYKGFEEIMVKVCGKETKLIIQVFDLVKTIHLI